MSDRHETGIEQRYTKKDLRNTFLSGLFAGLVLGWLTYEFYLWEITCQGAAICL